MQDEDEAFWAEITGPPEYKVGPGQLHVRKVAYLWGNVGRRGSELKTSQLMIIDPEGVYAAVLASWLFKVGGTICILILIWDVSFPKLISVGG